MPRKDRLMFGDSKLFITPEGYLKTEREAAFRSEYHNGVTTAMAGASRNHNRVSSNITTALTLAFKGQDCNNYSSDMRVAVQDGKRYLYPDIVITCGKESYQDTNFDVLINPVAIFEILLKSTESYDRGDKFKFYQSIKTLKTYVLVTPDPERIEVLERHGDDLWHYFSYNDFPSKITLQQLSCTLHSEDIFDKTTAEMDTENLS